LFGRILYGGFFIPGGINHFLNLGMMSGLRGVKGSSGWKDVAIIFSSAR
jgi:hypothetical protein